MTRSVEGWEVEDDGGEVVRMRGERKRRRNQLTWAGCS
jgi:hypothetical protein